MRISQGVQTSQGISGKNHLNRLRKSISLPLACRNTHRRFPLYTNIRSVNALTTPVKLSESVIHQSKGQCCEHGFITGFSHSSHPLAYIWKTEPINITKQYIPMGFAYLYDVPNLSSPAFAFEYLRSEASSLKSHLASRLLFL